MVSICKFLTVLYYQGEISSSTCTRHFPSQYIVHGAVLVYCGLYACFVELLAVDGGGDHAREHGNLCFKRCFVSCGKIVNIVCEDGSPAGISSISQSFHLVGGDVFILYHATSWSSGSHRYHYEMVFKESERHFVLCCLYLFRPEIVVVIVSAESWNTDAD